MASKLTETIDIFWINFIAPGPVPLKKQSVSNSERETPRKRGSPTPPSSDSSDESVLIAPKRKKNPAYALTPGHDESFQGTEVPNLVPGSISSAATLMNATAEYIWSKSSWFVGRIVLWLGMLFQDTPPLYLTEISKTERI